MEPEKQVDIGANESMHVELEDHSDADALMKEGIDEEQEHDLFSSDSLKQVFNPAPPQTDVPPSPPQQPEVQPIPPAGPRCRAVGHRASGRTHRARQQQSQVAPFHIGERRREGVEHLEPEESGVELDRLGDIVDEIADADNVVIGHGRNSLVGLTRR